MSNIRFKRTVQPGISESDFVLVLTWEFERAPLLVNLLVLYFYHIYVLECNQAAVDIPNLVYKLKNVVNLKE